MLCEEVVDDCEVEVVLELPPPPFVVEVVLVEDVPCELVFGIVVVVVAGGFVGVLSQSTF